MTRLYDNLFTWSGACAMSSGDRTHARPRYVRWDHAGNDGPYDKAWYTDGQRMGINDPRLNVKWLLEPRDNHPENFTREALEGFDVIYTHDPEILARPRARVMYLGGTRIHESDWGANPAPWNALPSIVASPKRGLPGHRLRHELIAATAGKLLAYGPEYTPIREKVDGMTHSNFAVCIEPVKSPHYFSEHLLDALLTRNIPVYWGADKRVLEDCGFDTSGIIFADGIAALVDIVRDLSDPLRADSIYSSMCSAITPNLIAAMAYVMPEDWLYRADPTLFDEVWP